MQTLINRGSVIQDRWTLVPEATGPEILEVFKGKDLISDANMKSDEFFVKYKGFSPILSLAI